MVDDDGDGMINDWELHYGLDHEDALDANLDLDGDGCTNFYEYENLGVPNNADVVPKL